MTAFSESSEQNKHVILDILRAEFAWSEHVLEIGSGTGQHAVFFAAELPHLTWQPSDRLENLADIRAWLESAPASNLRPAIELDVRVEPWPVEGSGEHYDAVFSANTAHIMDHRAVRHLFQGVARILPAGGRFALYGPFNYNGRYTSDSNARFDQWLKDRDPDSGIKDFADLNQLADGLGLSLKQDHRMPANNRTLVWEKSL